MIRDMDFGFRATRGRPDLIRRHIALHTWRTNKEKSMSSLLAALFGFFFGNGGSWIIGFLAGLNWPWHL